MMTNVYCIVGLPGSGKTYLANKMALELENAYVIDDIISQDQLPDNGIYSDIIITDPNFCEFVIRTSVNHTLGLRYNNVNWIFFENNKEKCLINIAHRNDGRKVVALIQHLHRHYIIPKDYTPLDIWQP